MGAKTISESTPITVAEAAEILDRSPQQVRNLARTGIIPSTRFGNAYSFKREDVEAMVGQLPRSGWPKGKPRPPSMKGKP